MRLRRECNCHGGDDGCNQGFVDVCAHARDVANVVTNVVRNAARVARIIFRNAFYHLACDVRTDVSGLGVDAAADAREQCDRRGANREAVKHGGKVRIVNKEKVEPAKAEKRRGRNEEAHHCAAVQGGEECVGLAALARCLGRSNIRKRRSLHSDEAGEQRKESADQEACAGK